MSVIKLPLLYEGTKGDARLVTLFDSGANLSCINSSFVAQLGGAAAFSRVKRLGTASNVHFIEIKERITLDFFIHDILLSDEFLVVPNLSEEAIIGAATLQKWRIKLNFDHDTVDVDPKVAILQLKKGEALAALC